MNFSDAPLTRSASGTSITITGAATFTDGLPADTTTGMFTLATSSQSGMASAVQFTFTSNASTTAVPEPLSITLLGTGLLGLGFVRRKRQAA